MTGPPTFSLSNTDETVNIWTAARGDAGKKGARRVNYYFVTFESKNAAQHACNESERSINGRVRIHGSPQLYAGILCWQAAVRQAASCSVHQFCPLDQVGKMNMALRITHWLVEPNASSASLWIKHSSKISALRTAVFKNSHVFGKFPLLLFIN
jgi:hypothetical protein